MKKLFLMFLIFITTGCNYKELNNIAITRVIGIDKNGNNYEVSLVISNSKKDDNSIEENNVLYEGTGKTFYEAYIDATKNISKQIYMGHIEVLLLSSEVCNDIENILNYLYNSPNSRNDFYVAVAKDNAKEIILKSLNLNQNIFKNLKNTSIQSNYIYTVTFNDFINNIISPGIDPVLPSIKISDDKVKLDNMVIFKGSKLKTFSNEIESSGINIINNKIDNGYIKINYKDKDIVSKIDKLNTKIIYKDDYFIIDSNIIISIIENSIDLNEINLENIKNKNIEEIKKMMDAAIILSKDNKTDIFGFGNILYKNDLKKWNNIKDNWENIYPLINIKYNINLKINDTYVKEDNFE